MRNILITLALIGTGVYFFLPNNEELDAQDFAKVIKSENDKILIDLRPSKDFLDGHISGATNIDSDSRVYKWRIAELDTAIPVFLYCKEGNRSSKTAAYMRSQGFVSVKLLKGGLKSWLAEQYPLTPQELIPPDELTFEIFSRILDLEHLVIVEFYLPGEKNCRTVGAVLDELSVTYSGKIKIFRIDIDEYKYLATEMGIESVPTLQFYENGNLCGTIEGAYGRERIESAFNLREYNALVHQ